MASSTLSRSSSATFAPGPHRRSHPNLQNLHTLSLAPLTPKYPIDPADYEAYFDPNTAELHSTTSLSHIASLPSPGGILTKSPARSRNGSRVRKKAKSNIHVQLPAENHPSSSHQDEPSFVDNKLTTTKDKSKQSKSHPHLHKLHTDPSWLVQTGLSLTESSRETKGQSWIGKRDSSTSLANMPSDGFMEGKKTRDGPTPRSGRATPARSRIGSRNPSRNASRSRLHGLHMTSAGSDGSLKEMHGASFATAPEMDDQIKEEDEDSTKLQPNWADARTQAEMAAHLQAELGSEFGDDGDPYGMLDFEGQGDSSSEDEEDAEEEVRKAMKKWRVGGWLDGAVDALLMVEESGEASKQKDLEAGTNEGNTIYTKSKGGPGYEAELDEVGEEVMAQKSGYGDWIGSVMKRNLGL